MNDATIFWHALYTSPARSATQDQTFVSTFTKIWLLSDYTLFAAFAIERRDHHLSGIHRPTTEYPEETKRRLNTTLQSRATPTRKLREQSGAQAKPREFDYRPTTP